MQNSNYKDHVQSLEDFLKKEYDYLTQLHIDNEQLGERRIQFFLSLVGGIIGIIGLFGISDPSFFTQEYKIKLLLFVFVIISVILIFFGIMSLNRLIRRNVITDEYKVYIDCIRKYFKDKDVHKIIIDYLPFKDQTGKGYSRIRKLTLKEIFSSGKGGLVETAALLNTVLIALIAGAITLIFNIQRLDFE